MAGVNRELALAGKTDIDRWSNAASLELAWDRRAAFAATFIPAGARVLDLGCGRMALRGFLREGCDYRGCDLVARDAHTIVCDFNKGDFPSAEAADVDVLVLLGVLEYIADLDAFFARLRDAGREIVLSYCAADFTSLDRPSLGWINSLTLADLATLFDRFGFRVVCSERVDEFQIVIKLRRAAGAELPACSVAVVSCADFGNFGDRLGIHIINSLLPPQADVHHLTFRTLREMRESYDLVVLGIGNSLFRPFLVEGILDVVARGKASIGIFGTQYRGDLSRPILDSLIERLDMWYARYQDDVLLYGRGRSNVTHMGDWLVTQFPMARGTDPNMLTIGPEILEDKPLDRTISQIQRFRNVFSPRLHPLLCALTSAELVAYEEQREASGVMSGKFASMLIDVFGRTFEERKFFPVDRSAVTSYKAYVDGTVARATHDVRAMLRNVATAAV